MLRLRGFDTVKVSKVKGHATRAMVDNGDVRLEDLVGNSGADAAADFGRLRQHDGSGGTAPDAVVWDDGGLVKTRSLLPASYRGSRYSSSSPCFFG